MTFRLVYLGLQGDLQEAVSVIDRYCSLTRTELYEQIMNEVERILHEKDLPDTQTVMSAFYEMLHSWKQDTTAHLVANIIRPDTYQECLKRLLERQKA